MDYGFTVLDCDAVYHELLNTSEELNAQWYGNAFEDVHKQTQAIDELIMAFNEAAAK